MSLDPKLVTYVMGVEGFAPTAFWDYKQWTNGYGTRAHFPHETISKATAQLRLMIELEAAQASVDHFRAQLPDGIRAALTDLTFDAGTGWMHAGLGEVVTSGDTDEIKTHLLEYDMAGGKVNAGLVERRKTEASWF
jgi:lysozyme